MAEKENFYEELDKKAKRSFCTCQTLALSLLVFIIIVVVAATFLVKKVKTAVAPQRKVAVTSQESTSLQQKVADLAKAPGASTSLTITEGELTSLMAEAISKNSDVPLRDVQAQIDPNEIVLNAKATKFLNSSLAISIVPKVVDGRPVLELVKIQAGTLTVPKQLTETVSKQLEKMLEEQVSQLKETTIKSIRLGDGRMTISGTLGTQPPAAPSSEEGSKVE